MHVPDGYLSPATVGAMYVAAAPFWAIAAARVRRAMGGRTVPLLAIFSAFTFAIGMFNVPVPGGTTAHGVGGTLAAIVLGPWAAVISTSVALILQALFFGDGGITAIGVNCFNMGVALPMTGYAAYRLFARGSGPLDERRVIAGAIGGYAGITIAAILVGVQLGIQPRFWSIDGVPQYSPYGLGTAISAMLVSHLFGASFVEAAITALGVGYLQRSMPDLLGSGPAARAGHPWRAVGALVLLSTATVFVAGLVMGGGLATWGRLDWSSVDWRAAGESVLVSAIVSAVVLPALVVTTRRAGWWRGPAILFAAMVIWFPIGLIAPGGAFAEEESVTQAELQAALDARVAGNPALFNALPDVNRQCECVPTGIHDVTYARRTLLAGYRPPWVSETDPAWKQNLGYQFAGLIGLGTVALIGLAAARIARRLAPPPPPDWRTAQE